MGYSIFWIRTCGWWSRWFLRPVVSYLDMSWLWSSLPRYTMWRVLVLKKRQLKLGFPKLWNILRKRFKNSCAKFTCNCRMPVQQPAIGPTLLTCYRRSCRAGWAGQPRGSSINSNNYSNKSHYERFTSNMFAYTNIYYYSPQGDCKIKTKIHQYLRVSRG